MTLIVDTGPLYAQADRRNPGREPVVDILLNERGPLVVSAFVAAETDYLITKRLGIDAEIAFLRDVAEGTYAVECLSSGELELAREVIEAYRDLTMGLADASMVVLARRYGTRRLLTFDERHFRAVRPLQGGSFTILPADA
ncbi:MAG: PIN domain-containing protein [Actinomycetota bacterium]|nr:PIN domain-containing protein [Actinomycetota bacterium]